MCRCNIVIDKRHILQLQIKSNIDRNGSFVGERKFENFPRSLVHAHILDVDVQLVACCLGNMKSKLQ